MGVRISWLTVAMKRSRACVASASCTRLVLQVVAGALQVGRAPHQRLLGEHAPGDVVLDADEVRDAAAGRRARAPCAARSRRACRPSCSCGA
jgi:hypothetical protein